MEFRYPEMERPSPLPVKCRVMMMLLYIQWTCEYIRILVSSGLHKVKLSMQQVIFIIMLMAIRFHFPRTALSWQSVIGASAKLKAEWFKFLISSQKRAIPTAASGCNEGQPSMENSMIYWVGRYRCPQMAQLSQLGHLDGRIELIMIWERVNLMCTSLLVANGFCSVRLSSRNQRRVISSAGLSRFRQMEACWRSVTPETPGTVSSQEAYTSISLLDDGKMLLLVDVSSYYGDVLPLFHVLYKRDMNRPT
mmetsp:Transcript_8231/g.13641  ORF Transcript_8231/g.13641 Transcript_8231/m.13641 type:complete len:250 (+) Transcript_8231:187-936(+)